MEMQSSHVYNDIKCIQYITGLFKIMHGIVQLSCFTYVFFLCLKGVLYILQSRIRELFYI